MAELRERRAHTRIRILKEIDVHLGNAWQPALLQDLSLGGARFLVLRGSVEVGQTIDCRLPVEGARDVELSGSVVRYAPADSGISVSVRFSALDRDVQARLRDLQAALLHAGRASAEPATISRRLSLTLRGRSGPEAQLEEVSRRCLKMRTDGPLAEGEELAIVMPKPGQDDFILLRCRVAEVDYVSPNHVFPFAVSLDFSDTEADRVAALDAWLTALIREE